MSFIATEETYKGQGICKILINDGNWIDKCITKSCYMEYLFKHV